MLAQLREVCRSLKTVSYLDMGRSTTDNERRCQPTTDIFDRYGTDSDDIAYAGRALEQMRFEIG